MPIHNARTFYSICVVVQNLSSPAWGELGGAWAKRVKILATAIESPSSRRTARIVSLHVQLLENIARDCIHIADWGFGMRSKKPDLGINRIHTARFPVTNIVRGMVIEM